VALEQSIVFRQLEQGGRFSRFDLFDAVLVLVPFDVHYLLELIFAGSMARPWVTLFAAAVFVYFLRARFPEGVTPLIHVLVTPRALSSLAPDQILRPYPPAARKRVQA
jgi:hypothetical protein